MEERHPNVENPLKSNKKVDNEKNISEDKYYYSLDLNYYLKYLAGFIRINTFGALITMETENYQIDGKKGNWIATDTIIIDRKQFYLMEHIDLLRLCKNRPMMNIILLCQRLWKA